MHNPRRHKRNPGRRHTAGTLTMNKTNPKSGQALAEFVVGLIALLALISCLTVAASLITGHTNSMAEARKKAAATATTAGDEILSTERYIKDWTPWTNPFETRTPARRTSRYTRFDTPVEMFPTDFKNLTLNKAIAQESDWDIIGAAHGNAFATLRGTTSFGLVQGEDSRTISIDGIPFMWHFFGITSIQVENKVWLPLINGLY